MGSSATFVVMVAVPSVHEPLARVSVEAPGLSVVAVLEIVAAVAGATAVSATIGARAREVASRVANASFFVFIPWFLGIVSASGGSWSVARRRLLAPVRGMVPWDSTRPC